MKLLPYSEETLAEELANKYTSIEVIKEKNHFLYLSEYFGKKGLQIKTIVVEENYVSKDYLKDYSSYYATCFKDYEKHCKRLHFFSKSFSQEDFTKALITENKTFWSEYAGFIVIKPLPITVIGTTVLKNYPKGKAIGQRNFWGTRPYKIHLYGKELVLDSLAFQEQDTVMSACATTAIWSMLHRASEDYSIVLKTPGEITQDAGDTMPNKGRLLPNKEGLEVNQMLRAIENSGLEVEIRLPSGGSHYIQNKYLQKLINAYGPIGLPLILIVRVPSGFTDPKAEPRDLPTNIKYGIHAVAVPGFLKKPLESLNKKQDRGTVYSLIEKIYCHDDQWGPFARIKLIGNHELNTTWSIYHKSQINPSSCLEGVIIPVFPKIRISYDDVEPLIYGISEILRLSFEPILQPGQVWDIRVMYSEDLKTEILSVVDMDESEKLKFLTASLPKYVWVGTCYSKEVRIADFIFDATDISNGMYLKKVLVHIKEIKEHLFKFLIEQPKYESYFIHTLRAEYFRCLLEQLKN